jgi:hypothetical protein
MRSIGTRARCWGRGTDRGRSQGDHPQFSEVLPAVLEPGERVLGRAYGVSGPNPLWGQGLLGLAGFLIFGMRYY